MTVYDQVEKMLNQSEKRPQWADEMLFELREIKRLLQQNRHKGKKHDKEYYRFVNRIRDELRADLARDIYPEIRYKGRMLGIDLKGYIYDKITTKNLPSHEAFAVYRFLYDNRERLDEYLIR